MLRRRDRSPRAYRNAPAPRRDRPGVEKLESRTLLSASPAVAAPLGRVAHPAVSIATLTNPTQPPFTPAAIRAAYGFDRIRLPGGHGGDGAGQTIAIVDAFNDPNITGDLAVFDHFFGLPAPPSFTVLNEFGTSDLRNVANSPSFSWALEESIDVEWAHAIAPKANIVLFEANSPSNIDLDTADGAATQPGVFQFIGVPAAGVVSDSFFTPEGTNPNTQETQSAEQFEDAAFFRSFSNKQSVTVLAAAGDFGTQGYPAVSPYVLGVGGTALTLKPSGKSGVAYSSETAWSITPNSSSPTGFIGTGGGTSLFEPEPAAQAAYGINTGGFRASPDVSMDASSSTPVNFVDSFDFPNADPTREFAFGTSIATPMWAGLLTIVNQGRAALGRGVLANAQEAVYQIPASDFHDITSGFNVVASAGPGYDEVTGIGTPIANRVVDDLLHVQTGFVVLTGATAAAAVRSWKLPSGPGATSHAAAGTLTGTGAADPAAGASLAAAATDADRLASRVVTAATPPASVAPAGSVVRGDSAGLAAPPGIAAAVVEGFHGRSDAAAGPADAAALPADPGTAFASADSLPPAAGPAVEVTAAVPPAVRAGTEPAAAFADCGSDPAVELSAPPIDIRVPATAGDLAAEETHSVDLAVAAGLVLALAGPRVASGRADEVRRHPALRV